MSFNTTHPELRSGEVFLMNAREFEWGNIPYMTKRRGQKAYMRNGTPIPADEGAFPVFVLRKEKDALSFAPGRA